MLAKDAARKQRATEVECETPRLSAAGFPVILRTENVGGMGVVGSFKEEVREKRQAGK